MTRCCWYYTNVNTLLRYLRNLVALLFLTTRKTDIGRYQEPDF